jgi:hypothetical protein
LLLAHATQIELQLDAPLTLHGDLELFVVPPAAYSSAGTPIADASGVLKGHIVIRAPSGHKIGHNGVTIALDQYLVTADPFIITDLLHHEDAVLGPGIACLAIEVSQFTDSVLPGYDTSA